MSKELEQRIVELVEARQGLKGTELAVLLATEFIAVSTDDITSTIERLAMYGTILEVEYSLPRSYKNKSFYLPKGSNVEVR